MLGEAAAGAVRPSLTPTPWSAHISRPLAFSAHLHCKQREMFEIPCLGRPSCTLFLLCPTLVGALVLTQPLSGPLHGHRELEDAL